jgi:ABC-type cobalamin/Fe3+-siderophores transport system ATPase subunit
MTGNTIAVEATDLVKTFGETRALHGVSLTVRRGLVYGVLGPNGAGKTTMIRILATLLRADSGAARVLGHDTRDEADAVRAVGDGERDAADGAHGAVGDLQVANLEHQATSGGAPIVGTASISSRV